MNKPILIIQNITREGPGLIETTLNERGVTFEVVDLSKNEQIPDLTQYAALIVLGGPDSANDATSKMKLELELVRSALAQKLPYLGICLGLQVLVKAAGGTVVSNPVKEIGFRDPDDNLFEIHQTTTGQIDSLTHGLPLSFPIFQLHGETVELTESMELLATSKYCINQIVKVAPQAYGIQGHVEFTQSMFEVWSEEDPDLKQLDREKLQQDYTLVKQQLTENGRRIINNFIDLID